jgi:ATP-dependent DNA helicase RecG
LELVEGAEGTVDKAIERTVAEGRQVFVVCPLVDDSDKLEARSATSEYERLVATLPDLRIGLLHGQMPSDDKALQMDRVMQRDIDVLVATTVIEVGIDVPNATLIVVWNAERFGLSQLHQLRGRVGRGVHPGACLLVADVSTDDAARRVEAMVESGDGFALAEVDLEIRGHGTLFGSAQSGAGDLRFGDLLRDADLIEMAAETARDAVANDRNSMFVRGVMDEFRLFMGEDAQWLARS